MLGLLPVTVRAALSHWRLLLAAGAGTAALCAAGLAAAPPAGAVTAAGTATQARAAAPAGITAAGAAAPAGAAAALPPPQSSLQEITGFGPNPTGLRMYLYVPAHVRPHPAVVVALHLLRRLGAGVLLRHGVRLPRRPVRLRRGVPVRDADVARVLRRLDPRRTHPPRAQRPRRDRLRGPLAEQHLHADRHRVFATGISSGAMMTNVLLGDYPDVFRAGSAMSGVAFGCFATTDGSLWNCACANGDVSKTPQQWGDLVRAADPGYRGPRPRMQLWHGTADTILYYPNFGEEVKQWTNVLHARLALTDHPQPTWTHTVYVSRAGQVQVDAYSVAGETHNLGFDYPDWAQLAIRFFGLSGPGAPPGASPPGG